MSFFLDQIFSNTFQVPESPQFAPPPEKLEPFLLGLGCTGRAVRTCYLPPGHPGEGVELAARGSHPRLGNRAHRERYEHPERRGECHGHEHSGESEATNQALRDSISFNPEDQV